MMIITCLLNSELDEIFLLHLHINDKK